MSETYSDLSEAYNNKNIDTAGGIKFDGFKEAFKVSYGDKEIGYDAMKAQYYYADIGCACLETKMEWRVTGYDDKNTGYDDKNIGYDKNMQNSCVHVKCSQLSIV